MAAAAAAADAHLRGQQPELLALLLVELQLLH
jgi:hypothetical protein